MLKTRDFIVPVALFALAFTGAMYALRAGAPLAAVPPTGASASPAVPGFATPSSLPRRASVAAAPAVAARAVDERAVDRPSAVASASAPAPAVEPPVAEAMQPAVPAAVGIEQATDAIANSIDRAERIRALRAVVVSAQTAREVARVRATLKDAAADEDPDVAQRAQEEYDRLLERLDR